MMPTASPITTVRGASTNSPRGMSSRGLEELEDAGGDAEAGEEAEDGGEGRP